MARVDVSRYQTFGDITERLDDIVAQVRDKDVSLEHSLDLFDEAIALGSKAVSLVDATDFSPEEEARLVEEHRSAQGGADDAEGEGVAAEKGGDPEATAPDEE
ncbi:exodeoxyribonuclease VII small subunit [Thermophilibacter provencensis]|uniref:exodeoxyribonuclease VII small subunit n=1 Tax=Thermophilibacter provencensis TaxID=1852386 RepID=UPI002941DDF6|nr:exodeoxyribonuclease VII small subunit [Thermophilibacter provencensis]